MGNRTLKTLPVAMSLLTSYISAIGLLGYSGEIYGNGMQIGSIILGGPSALIFASYFVLPVLYPLKLTSINEILTLNPNLKLGFSLYKICRAFYEFLYFVVKDRAE
ncbi:hypothetical protein Avbf_10989 [Armadillidium vulgare]|nr:hypothetical protein Avbf_10989 [Armadillidium vulgare]